MSMNGRKLNRRQFFEDLSSSLLFTTQASSNRESHWICAGQLNSFPLSSQIEAQLTNKTSVWIRSAGEGLQAWNFDSSGTVCPQKRFFELRLKNNELWVNTNSFWDQNDFLSGLTGERTKVI